MKVTVEDVFGKFTTHNQPSPLVIDLTIEDEYWAKFTDPLAQYSYGGKVQHYSATKAQLEVTP